MSATSSKTAIIAGSVAGAVTLVVLVILIVYCIRRRSQKEREGPYHPEIGNGSLHNLAERPDVTGKWMERDIDKDCSICLHPHCSVLLQCRHNFHINCIVAWSNKNSSCPLCRGELLDQVS